MHGTERDGRSRFTSIISFAIILPAALLTTAIFIVDVVLVAVARNKIRDALNDNRSVHLTWDSAVSPNPLVPFIIQNTPGLTSPVPRCIIHFPSRSFLYMVILLGLVDPRGGPRPLVCPLRHHLSMREPAPILVRVNFRFCWRSTSLALPRSPASFFPLSRGSNPSFFPTGSERTTEQFEAPFD